MGDLIVMTRPPKESVRSPRPNGASADILFFTGVRYYRYDDAPPVPAGSARRRRTDRRSKAADLQRTAITL